MQQKIDTVQPVRLGPHDKDKVRVALGLLNYYGSFFLISVQFYFHLITWSKKRIAWMN